MSDKGIVEGLELLTCSLRVSDRVLRRVSGGCKTRIPKLISFPYLALYCTVLRSRWCQSGVSTPWITRRRFLRRPDLSSFSSDYDVRRSVFCRLAAFGLGLTP
jgi:hypothetical protein